MIHWLQFTLPEDEAALYDAQHGGAYRDVLRVVDQYLRDKLKYDLLGKEGTTRLQGARDFLRTECQERSLTLE